MAMTLRVTEAENESLRARARGEGRAIPGGPRQALRDYVAKADRRERLDAVLASELPRYADALRRLGE